MKDSIRTAKSKFIIKNAPIKITIHVYIPTKGLMLFIKLYIVKEKPFFETIKNIDTRAFQKLSKLPIPY